MNDFSEVRVILQKGIMGVRKVDSGKIKLFSEESQDEKPA